MTIAPVFSCATGLPFSPTVSGNSPSGAGSVTSGDVGASGSSRVPFLERNSFRMPGIDTFDLRFSRMFTLHERAKLEIIAQSYNVLNHVNYTGVVTEMYTTGGTAAVPTMTFFPTFGTLNAASNTVLSARQVELGARVTF